MVRGFTHHHYLIQFFGPGRVVSLEYLNVECIRRNFIIKDSLCIEGAVVIPNTCMITTNNKMGRAHVLAEVGMPVTIALLGGK